MAHDRTMKSEKERIIIEGPSERFKQTGETVQYGVTPEGYAEHYKARGFHIVSYADGTAHPQAPKPKDDAVPSEQVARITGANPTGAAPGEKKASDAGASAPGKGDAKP